MSSAKLEGAASGNAGHVKLQIAVLVAIALIGLIHLPRPFFDDQAEHTVFALRMHQGAVLYRDLWDNKQPLIFAFYFVAGNLFGFTETGIHAFELLYLLIFAVVLMRLVRTYYPNAAMPAVAALLLFGFYYCATGITHQTQIEGVAGFPIFLAIWSGCEAVKPGNRSRLLWFWAGVFAAVAFLFKFLLIIIIAAAWLGTFFTASRDLRSRRRLREFFVAAGCILLGFSLVFGACCAYFFRQHALGGFIDSLFVYPWHAFRELSLTSSDRMLRSLRWFTNSFAPLIALSVVAATTAFGRGADVRARALLIWMAGALLVIALQSHSWWEYHFMLFVVPLALLAAKGIEILFAAMRDQLQWSPRKSGAVLGLSLALLCTPAINSLGMRALMLVHYHFALNPADRLAYQCHDTLHEDSFYPRALGELSRLDDKVPGPIWVVDDPLYYFLSHRMPAVQQNLQPDYLLPGQWADLAAQVKQAQPSYIFIMAPYSDLVPTRAPEIQAFIAQNYSVLHRSEVGTWYVIHQGSANRRMKGDPNG